MDQYCCQFILHIHEHQYKFVKRQRELGIASPNKLTLGDRSLLYLSDLMLNLGQRIRPTKFSKQTHGLQANDGTLGITAKGC